MALTPCSPCTLRISSHPGPLLTPRGLFASSSTYPYHLKLAFPSLFSHFNVLRSPASKSFPFLPPSPPNTSTRPPCASADPVSQHYQNDSSPQRTVVSGERFEPPRPSSESVVYTFNDEQVGKREVESGGGDSRPGGGDGLGGNGGDGTPGNGRGGEDDPEDRIKKMSPSQILTLVYAALVGVGGVIGYAKKKSLKSLVSGALSSLLLCYICTQLPTNPVFASSLGLGISGALVTVSIIRFKKTGKIVPAGVLSLVSFIMAGGYIHGIIRTSHV